ncbi:phosphoribosylaminoimidazolesuccinocarboxamide synthase [soil metagenome]
MTLTRHIGSGKVRELFAIGEDKLLLVASDRISAYDVVLGEDIPDKGKVLTGLSHFWFEITESICPNHCISVRAHDLPDLGIADLPGRAMLCHKAQPIPIEFVVRGYLSGSGLKEYRATGAVCGHELPQGLVEADRLPQPILTPATKAISGHDENITEAEARQRVGPVYDAARAHALAIYERAAETARSRGILIADTKFEFGLFDGEVMLIDEVLTPDSSRFWPEDSYRPGGGQPSFDKQWVRDWLDSAGWDRTPPPPELPAEVVASTRARYVDAYEAVTGRPFAVWTQEVSRA